MHASTQAETRPRACPLVPSLSTCDSYPHQVSAARVDDKEEGEGGDDETRARRENKDIGTGIGVKIAEERGARSTQLGLRVTCGCTVCSTQ